METHNSISVEVFIADKRHWTRVVCDIPGMFYDCSGNRRDTTGITVKPNNLTQANK